jgi:hypothetical protein
VPSIITYSDFWNTYTILGLCGVDTSTPPFFFNLNQFTNDSEAFSIAVEEAIIAGFLKSGDILVTDNAAIHVFGENDVSLQFSLGKLWDSYVDASNTFSRTESNWAAMANSCPVTQVNQSWSVLIHATSCCIPGGEYHEWLYAFRHRQVLPTLRLCSII